MAGNWIKVEHITPDKPEVAQMAEQLAVDVDAVFGKCMRVWIWADQHTIDGGELPVTSSFLDRLTNCPGFSSALIKVGWLVSRSGRYMLPNFARHNGQTAKNRALTNDRVKRRRNDQRVTESLPDLELELEEEKKKKKKEDPPLPPQGDPWFENSEFQESWAAWISGRKKKPTPEQLSRSRKKLRALSGGDLAVAVAILDESTANGWSGIFPLKNGHAPTPRRKTLKVVP